MSQGSSGPKVPRRVGKGSQSSSGSAASRPKKSAGKSADSSDVMKWAIRGVVGVVLIALLIVAGLDFMKKGQAGQTGTAWNDALDKAEAAKEPLKFSALDPLIAGSPDRVEKSLPEDPKTNFNKIYTYTWSGTFRNYPIEVYVDEDKTSGATVTKIDILGGK